MTIAKTGGWIPWFARVARQRSEPAIDVAWPSSTKASAAIDELPPPTTPRVEPGPAASTRAEGAAGTRAHDLRALPPLADVAAGVAWQCDALLGPDHAATPSEIEARAQQLEDRAFEVLEVLTPKRIGEAEAAFDTWFAAVEARQQSGQGVAAMEHLTVVHILKTKIFESQPELAAYLPRMQALLRASDAQLSGCTRTLDDILERRLPRAVVAGLSDDARKIHAAIFASRDGTFMSAIGDLIRDWQPNAKDPIVAVGVLAAAFTGAGAPLVAGALHGYLLATLVEHTIHARLGHASPRAMEKMGAILERFGPLGRAVEKELESIYFGHAVIHHGSYAGSYVDRFAPDDDRLSKEQIDQKRAARKDMTDRQIEKRGPAEAAEIFQSDYGRRLANAFKNALLVAPATALITLFTGAVAGAAGVTLGPLFVAASVLTSLIFIPASNDVHPYLHMTRDEAMAQAGPLMRAFLNSRYVAHIAQHHYLHHKDARVNHNLVAGADFALGYEPTRVDAIVALRRLQSFY